MGRVIAVQFGRPAVEVTTISAAEFATAMRVERFLAGDEPPLGVVTHFATPLSRDEFWRRYAGIDTASEPDRVVVTKSHQTGRSGSVQQLFAAAKARHRGAIEADPVGHFERSQREVFRLRTLIQDAFEALREPPLLRYTNTHPDVRPLETVTMAREDYDRLRSGAAAIERAFLAMSDTPEPPRPAA